MNPSYSKVGVEFMRFAYTHGLIDPLPWYLDISLAASSILPLGLPEGHMWLQPR